jgi:hypothetical protein
MAVEGADVRLPSLPRPLRWLVPAREHAVDAAGNLSIGAAGPTDWFIDPGSGADYHNAPALVMDAPGPWQFSARVSADHRATFDAGVLFVHVNDENWAKLCLELSPQAEVTVVSVVTRGTSDGLKHTFSRFRYPLDAAQGFNSLFIYGSATFGKLRFNGQAYAGPSDSFIEMQCPNPGWGGYVQATWNAADAVWDIFSGAMLGDSSNIIFS